MQPPCLITGVETYASLLQAARKKAKLTQTQLAQRAGVAQGTIGNIESGERPNPSSESLAKIAKALGLLVDDLSPRSKKLIVSEPPAAYRITERPSEMVGIVAIDSHLGATNSQRAPVVAWSRLGDVLFTTERTDLAEAPHLPVIDGTSPQSVWAVAETDSPRFGVKRGRKLLFSPVVKLPDCIDGEVYLFSTLSGTLILAEFRRLAGDGYEAIPDSGPPLEQGRHGVVVLAALMAIYR